MRLFSALIPPPEVVAELADRARSVDAGEGGGAGRSRWRRGSSPKPAAAPEIAFVEPADMYLPITSFGNVTLGDSVRLANALRVEAATWLRAEVHFSGATALEWPGDESVWAKIAGDVDSLMAVGRGVPEIVKRLGFFVDRRQFRPWLSVGTITEQTTTPYLERLVANLDEFTGQWWTASEVTLLRHAPTAGGTVVEEVERMPLEVAGPRPPLDDDQDFYA